MCVCVCVYIYQESSSSVGNRSMRYEGHVGEMPSAGQLILGTTPRDHFLLELGLLDLRPAARFLTSRRSGFPPRPLISPRFDRLLYLSVPTGSIRYNVLHNVFYGIAITTNCRSFNPR